MLLLRSSIDAWVIILIYIAQLQMVSKILFLALFAYERFAWHKKYYWQKIKTLTWLQNSTWQITTYTGNRKNIVLQQSTCILGSFCIIYATTVATKGYIALFITADMLYAHQYRWIIAQVSN